MNHHDLCINMSVKAKAKPAAKKQVTPGASPEEKRARAFDMYVNTNLNQKKICEIVGWTEKTFKDNKDKGGWEALKGAQTITSNSLVSKLYLKADKLVSAGGDDVDADKLIKLAKSIDYLSNKKVTLSQHINCAEEFCAWAFGKDPELAKKINLLQQAFITEKGSERA